MPEITFLDSLYRVSWQSEKHFLLFLMKDAWNRIKIVANVANTELQLNSDSCSTVCLVVFGKCNLQTTF